jgi:hypothetical protein
MWSFLSFMRIVRALLEQPWATRAAATVSFLSLMGGLIGWIVDWPYYLRSFSWGVIWALVALGARAMNR